jgi:DICT domain-containing protein
MGVRIVPTGTHGDWIVIPLAEYTPELEREVREEQRAQARRVLAELRADPETPIVEVAPRVILAWSVDVPLGAPARARTD